MPPTIIAVGAYINGALYLAGAFVAGFLTGTPFAWRLALVAAGLSFLCYATQAALGSSARIATIVAAALSVASIAAGIAAGVVLL